MNFNSLSDDTVLLFFCICENISVSKDWLVSRLDYLPFSRKFVLCDGLACTSLILANIKVVAVCTGHIVDTLLSKRF